MECALSLDFTHTAGNELTLACSIISQIYWPRCKQSLLSFLLSYVPYFIFLTLGEAVVFLTNNFLPSQ